MGLSVFNCSSVDTGPVLYLEEEKEGRKETEIENAPLYMNLFFSSDPFLLRMEEQVAPAIRRRVGLYECAGTLPISAPAVKSGVCDYGSIYRIIPCI
jgi:hypothetical protein